MRQSCLLRHLRLNFDDDTMIVILGMLGTQLNTDCQQEMVNRQTTILMLSTYLYLYPFVSLFISNNYNLLSVSHVSTLLNYWKVKLPCTFLYCQEYFRTFNILKCAL